MLQRTGAFKFRGACNAIGQLTDEERQRGVLTYSSGNHGQAISRAAGIFGVPATVIMPFDAPAIKKAATAHWGATIVEYDRYDETRAEVAERVLSGIDGDRPILVPPYDHEDVMAGQGTVGLELCTQVPDLDLIFVCLGGGGLLSGIAVAAKALQPQARLVGVEPATGNDHTLSRDAGERVSLPAVPVTIADGQQTLAPGELTWPISDSLTETFTVATDDEIVTAMRTLFLHHKLVAEPSGACALAGAMHRGLIEPGMRVGITLSGGNVDPAVFAKLVG
jgi:threonine dehydratase